MSFTIGLRFYRISIRKKGGSDALPMGPGCEPCDLIDYANDFVHRKTEPTVVVGASRTWFFEPLPTNSIRVVHGYINYGTHGFESKLKDVKTRRQKYKREATDLEEIPLYFQIWSPSSSDHALIAFQSFQGRSCINNVRLAMIQDFQERFPGFVISFRIIAASGAILGEAPVKALTFIKPKQSSDRFDRVLGRPTEELEYELTVRSRKRGGMISRYKDLSAIVSQADDGFVEFDGREFEGVKADVAIGKKRRTVGIFGSGSDAGLIDVSDNIKRDKSGHPTLQSIMGEVDELMEEFYGSVKT
ncbi:hypothetical protein GHK46_26350 [Sinorhizobium medicae]|uniref:hypothetical protein n=1 Tax=Sinorhizobium medicae TaxID=110321 RepID=UPI0012981F7E|nr:hypothetical protein [Sinorhizobium medicae]MQW00711.1 hypothetical protein [Sinorhizobium medicae]